MAILDWSCRVARNQRFYFKNVPSSMYSKHGVYLKFAFCGLIRFHVGTLCNQLFPVRPVRRKLLLLSSTSVSEDRSVANRGQSKIRSYSVKRQAQILVILQFAGNYPWMHSVLSQRIWERVPLIKYSNCQRLDVATVIFVFFSYH